MSTDAGCGNVADAVFAKASSLLLNVTRSPLAKSANKVKTYEKVFN